MAKKRKEKHEEAENGEAWLLPYSDLMTLLLAVFIVLFAVSKVDQASAESMANSFKGMLSGSNGVLNQEGDSIIEQYNLGNSELTQNASSDSGGTAQTPGPTSTTSGDDVAVSNGNSQKDVKKYLGDNEYYKMAKLQIQLQKLFKEGKIINKVSSVIDKRGLVVSLDSAVLFASGSATVNPSNEPVLIKLGKTLNSVDNEVRVEGHTDNVPIKTSTYPSNWELSSARATSIVKLFINECNVSPKKLVPVGYGQYRPIADNSTEEGRSKNRRVDIIIMSEKYDNLEK